LNLLTPSQDDSPLWLRFGSSSWNGSREDIGNDFEAYVERIYKQNGIVFACIQARMLPFSEARFQFQRMPNGRPGELFGGPELSLLENPWPNGTTGELLAHMEQDVSLAGNFYATVTGEGSQRRIRRLRPDWVTVYSGIRGVSDDAWEIESEVIGYMYTPRRGRGQAGESTMLTPEQVVHWSPTPDPNAQWRGMSWITPVLDEVKGDKAANQHKLKFFENGGTLGTVVSYDKDISPELFKESVRLFREGHRGLDRAYETVHIGGGADVKVVGADMKQLDFKATQGAGETRIAAASGVGAVIGRFSEGMAGSSLNQGNYQASKRQVADMLLRPNWRSAAAALSKFAPPPPGARLWYDDRDISFLAEDQKDAAAILSAKVTAITALTTNGFEPDAAVRTVQAMDLSELLGNHNGLPSVQQQTANAVTLTETPARQGGGQ